MKYVIMVCWTSGKLELIACETITTAEICFKALEETLVNGTLMMPSQVSMNCDPATWEYPPVRKDLIQVIQDAQCHLTMRKHLQLKV